jgi:hypothetical protein
MFGSMTFITGLTKANAVRQHDPSLTSTNA